MRQENNIEKYILDSNYIFIYSILGTELKHWSTQEILSSDRYIALNIFILLYTTVISCQCLQMIIKNEISMLDFLEVEPR